MIEVVMQNLLDNAWKYTAATSDVIITVERQISEDGDALICVADNGAGFDMAHASKLFQPFQRLHRQEEFSGIGIGLATVQRIIHRHGGVIHADSIPSQGARFCFSLKHLSIDKSDDEETTHD
jgi:signal transduction histidine kinase